MMMLIRILAAESTIALTALEHKRKPERIIQAVNMNAIYEMV